MEPWEYAEARTAADAQWQAEVEEAENRDVVWPVEKVRPLDRFPAHTSQSIYGKISVATSVEASQVESATVPVEPKATFRYPTGQLLEDGTIKAIPIGQQRWSDETGDNLIEYRNSSAPRRANFADMLQTIRRKPVRYSCRV